MIMVNDKIVGAYAQVHHVDIVKIATDIAGV